MNEGVSPTRGDRAAECADVRAVRKILRLAGERERSNEHPACAAYLALLHDKYGRKGTGLGKAPIFYRLAMMKTGIVGTIRAGLVEAEAEYVQLTARRKRAQQDGKAGDYWAKRRDKRSHWVKGCKERGEWAELCFMARAAGVGMGVLKPFGDSLRFDVGVLSGDKIWRVQVKSTIYCRRGNEYSLNVMGPGRKQYRKGTVDFFAVYVIPVNQWYIIPYEAMGNKCTVHFTPGGRRQKYARYLEAWELLRA